MSIFQRPMQPPTELTDQAVERYLVAVRAQVIVDPLFRRRLRGAVVNRYVAEREGRMARRSRRRMGGLGRAVLYASFALCVSVSTAMAASQGAVPGDGLYPLKLQIERLRFEALPAHLHDELAAHALGERIHELGELAERGDWQAVARQAASVEAGYVAYVRAVEANPGPAEPQLAVLDALLHRLPIQAQLAVSDVIAGVATAHEQAVRDPGNGPRAGAPGRGNGQGGFSAAGTGQGAAPATGAEFNGRTPEPAADPSASPTPAATEGPSASPTTSKTPKPRPTADTPASPDDPNADD